jgi:hypothetical protein
MSLIYIVDHVLICSQPGFEATAAAMTATLRGGQEEDEDGVAPLSEVGLIGAAEMGLPNCWCTESLHGI